VLLFPPQEGLDTWVAVFDAWRPRDTVGDAEIRDHVPYRDWERAGFIHLCDGDIIDYTQIEETIMEDRGRYQLRCLGTDPYLSRTLTQRLMDQGVEVIEIPQTMTGMSPAMKELERLIRAHEMLHVHNTAARWCFGNVRCAVDGNENQKPMKNRSTGRIDIAVAWIIAMATALQFENLPEDKLRHAVDSGEFSF
jgi:phage terminase large subunit-like protein